MAPPRIIAGSARGIRLRMVPGDITRPITDFVKEALFNILADDVVNSTWLDLFGGTGSVGLEALSRGASFCRFIDLHRPAVNTIKTNLEITRLKSLAQVVQADALNYLTRAPDRSFDYIYVAPPQYKGLWQQTLALLDRTPGWFGPESWILVQIDPVEDAILPLTNLELFDRRKYGSTLLLFYERKKENSDNEDRPG